MLGELAAKRNQSVLALTMPACPPLDGWALKKQAWHDECLGFQRRAIQRILETPSIRIVLLAGRFAGYPIGEPDSGFESAMRETIRRLRLAGKRVFVVYPVPEPGENIPIALARALEQGKLLEDGFRSASEFHETFFTVHSFLDQLVANEEINAIKPSEILCDRWRCFYYRDGVVFFYDEHHLSMSGANQLKTLFSNLFQSP
jgi:hypothetical protein